MSARRQNNLSPTQHNNVDKTNIKSIDKICAKLQLNMGCPSVEMNEKFTTSQRYCDNESISNESDACSGLGNLDESRSPGSATCGSPTFERRPVICVEEPARSDGCTEHLQVASNGIIDKMAAKDVEEKGKQKARHTTQYNNWHYTDMIMAIKAVQSKELSMTAAAKKYGIPRTTLRHYLNDGTNKEAKRACFTLPKNHEKELLNYALANSMNSEKDLYKLIVAKAKELSRRTALENGEEDRRTVPTPAWIRRFVYRHKQLYDLFPTFLTKFEHPLHGGRKTPNDMEDCSLPHDDNSSSHHSDAGSVDQEKLYTEIIFPKMSNDTPYYVKDGFRRNEREDYYFESDSRYDDRKTTSNIRHNGVKCHDTFGSYSMVGEEFSSDCYANKWRESDVMCKNGECFESDDERMLPYKDLLSRISRSTSSNGYQTISNSPLPHRATNGFIDVKSENMFRQERDIVTTSNGSVSRNEARKHQQYINLSSVSFLIQNGEPATTSPSRSEVYLPDTNNGTSKYDASFSSYSSPSVSYSERVKTPKSLTADYHAPRLMKFSEYNVMKSMLAAMEAELGNDYVELFSERYRRNQHLERLYSKWVLLKADIAQEGKEL